MRKKASALTVGILGFLFVVTSAELFAAEKKEDSFWDKTKVTGSADLNYNYNLNRPTTTPVLAAAGAQAANAYRVFDVSPNTFNVGLVELALENSPADWITFRTDLDFGRDAQFYHARGFGVGTDLFDLQQAFLVFNVDQVGHGLKIKAGKFVTMHGMEVIEAAANYNVSRGLLFNYAIPLTHTGILGSYSFSDQVSLDLGVVNGWNNVTDNNNGKSVHAMLTVKPVETVTFLLGGTVGPEQNGNDRTLRTLIDTSLIYAPTDHWTFAVNYDLGRDGGFGGTNGVADWQGVAAYADWKSGDLLGLTVRGEYLNDDTGAAGIMAGAATGATASTNLQEGTLTSHLYLADGMDLRFEYRHDHGNFGSFLRGNGTSRRFQDTLGAQLVYSF
ncbi:MAG: porin [Deltaproteobacteria bacterium]|nr:porin [Deltaproteobacteria bacterium]